jgi:hypothetical protein
MLDHLVCNLAVLFYFIEVPVPNQGSEHLSTILTFNFEIIPCGIFLKCYYTLMSSVKCISPLLLRVRISIRARCTTLCDKVCQ